MFGFICALVICTVDLYSMEIAEKLQARREKKQGWRYNDELDCIDIL